MSRVRWAVLSLAIAGWILVSAPAASAALTISTVTVSDFGTVTLDGTTKTTTATMDGFTVTNDDAIGWNVTVQATQFKEWDGAQYVAGGKTLASGSLSMPAPTVTAVDTVSPAPGITPGPYLIDGATVKIASAAPLEGIGRYDFTQGGPLSLTIQPSAYARTYRSEITVSVVAGP